MASAPWMPPAANDPRAIGLKNSGLTALDTDIIFPASRMVRGDFKGGSTMEFRFRSDSSRHWLPRETRLFVEYKFKFGETALTGSGATNKCMLVNTGAKAPQTLDAAGSGRAAGAPPNANIAMTAAPNASLFDQVRFVQNSVTMENNPEYYTTACAQLLTKTDRAGSDTTGSGMLNSLRKDHGKQLTDRMDHASLKWDAVRELMPSQSHAGLNYEGATGADTVYKSTFNGLDGAFDIGSCLEFTITALGGEKSLTKGDVIVQTATGAVGVLDANVAAAGTAMTLRVVTGTFSATDNMTRKSDAEAIAVSAVKGAVPDDGAQIQATPHRFANALALQKPFARGEPHVNPKCEILQMGYDESTGEVTVQVSEPIFLATWAHPYALPSSDYQLMLQISKDWLTDLLWCSDYSYGCSAGRGGIISPIPTSGKLEMGQVYCSIEKVELHCQFLSPMIPSIPRNGIGIKYSGMQVSTKLLQSATVQEQIVVPPSTRAVYLFLRQRFRHVCACREELGRAGAGYNEMVTSLPSISQTGGQNNPCKQGRAIPHNLATIKAGTSDGWIYEAEVPTDNGGVSATGHTGKVYWTSGKPKGASGTATNLDKSTDAEGYIYGFNKFSDTNSPITFVGDTEAGTLSRAASTPKLEQLNAESTTHFTDLQVQLGSAVAPTQPYSELSPANGKMIRCWSDMISALGKPLGLRGGVQNFSQYCGWQNDNGPSAASNGNFGPGYFLRILNPPNSLSNVLTVRGTLAATPQAAAQMELVCCVLHDNFMTVMYNPPSEIPLETATRAIV